MFATGSQSGMVWPLAEHGDKCRQTFPRNAALGAGLLGPGLALATFALIGRCAAQDALPATSVVSVGQDLVVSIADQGHMTSASVRSGIVLNLEALSESAAVLQGGPSSQILTELDCRQRQARTLSFRVFSAPRQSGDVVSRPTQFVWSPILAGTYLFEIADRLCQKPAGPPPPVRPTAATELRLRPVKLEPSGVATPNPAQAPPSFVQLYASDRAELAAAHYDQVITRKLALPRGASIYVEDATVRGRIIHRLRAGPFATREEAVGFCQGVRHTPGLEGPSAQGCFVAPAPAPRS